MELNKENMIWERPACAKEGCDNRGFALLGTKLVCTDCFVKYENKRMALLQENTDRIIAEL